MESGEWRAESEEWRVKGGDGESGWWKIYDVGDKPGVLIGCY